MAGCVCQHCVAGYGETSEKCIGSSWLFQNLESADKSALAAKAIRKEYKKGEQVFNQGDHADKMFLIKAGIIKISKVSRGGDEFILDIRRKGDFLGEQIFWDDFKYPGTATCMADCYICGYSRDAFEKLIMDYPKIGLNVVKNLSKHIEFLNSRASGMLYKDLSEKIYNFLLALAKEIGEKKEGSLTISFNLTHEEIGFFLGVHRVSVTKSMNILKKCGLIKKEGKKLLIAIPL